MAATITRDELKTKIDHGEKFRLVETLAPDKFKSSHLPGAVNLPPDQVQKQASKLFPDHNEEIVVYCGSDKCTASLDAAHQLEAQGYTHVRRYVGGKQDWTEAGLPTQGVPPASKMGV
jgi:rhodanese-related sulfurtransferase